MIDTSSIRAAARAIPGDTVGISKAQLDELLDEAETGQRARRELQLRHAVEGLVSKRTSCG